MKKALCAETRNFHQLNVKLNFNLAHRSSSSDPSRSVSRPHGFSRAHWALWLCYVCYMSWTKFTCFWKCNQPLAERGVFFCLENHTAQWEEVYIEALERAVLWERNPRKAFIYAAEEVLDLICEYVVIEGTTVSMKRAYKYTFTQIYR